tara:strand:- start:561 stop:2342 length:1782 start_codon:yes stop_codon:yes gene_type:complete
MANLTFGTLLKPFYSGDLIGKKRWTKISEKIKNKSPFQLTTGEFKLLDYASTPVKQAFENGNLDLLVKLVAGRTQPFKEVSEGQNIDESKPVLYAISALEKTKEFGGEGGGGKVADPHELMTAALIAQYGGSRRTVPTSEYESLSAADKHIKKLKSVAGRVKGHKPKDIAAFDGDYANYARAVSAANGFLSKLNQNSKVREVFQTGAKWSTEIAKYGMNSHELFGKQNYNSSDIVIRVESAENTKKIIGVSLKKKNKEKSADPTVINKTVTGERGLFAALVKQKDMPVLEKHLGKLYQARAQFFFNVIKAALNPPDLASPAQLKTRREAMKNLSIDNAEKVSKDYIQKYTKRGKSALPQTQMKFYQEEAAKLQEKKVQENIKAYLDKKARYITKQFSTSKMITKEISKIGDKNAKDSLFGAFPSFAPQRNIYFATLESILTLGDVSQKIAEGLLNIIFKLDLARVTNIIARNHGESFHFTLITGIGMLQGDTQVVVQPASVVPEEATTSQITKMLSQTKGKAYSIIPDPKYKQPHRGGTSASMKYQVTLNGYHIINLEIRYKGQIKPEPQFQAVITPQFTKLVKTKGQPDPQY